MTQSALLEQLRGESAARKPVDHELAGGLREWLEDAVADALGALSPDAPPVRVTPRSLTEVLACEAHQVLDEGEHPAMTVEIATELLVTALFRQWVTIGAVVDPLGDALLALEVTGENPGVGPFVAALPRGARKALAGELERHCAQISACWPVLSPTWFPRTHERLIIPLAGGRVLLSGILDLALGAPARDVTSVCIVGVQSGKRCPSDRHKLHFLSLLETLRSGAPPFRAARFFTMTGELDAESLDEQVLQAALSRTLEGTLRLCRIAAGAAPHRSSRSLCARCAVLDSRRPGNASTREEGPGSSDRVFVGTGQIR
jgi:hypothetical protein